MSQVSSKPENFSIINSKQEGDKRLECLGTASNLSVNCQLPGTDFLKAQRLACMLVACGSSKKIADFFGTN